MSRNNPNNPSSYEHVSIDEHPDDDDDQPQQQSSIPTARDDDDDDEEEIYVTGAQQTFRNFVLMSVLFSANHGCVGACLSLATSRLGSTGAWQSGILYLSYTLSSVLGATWVVKKFGSRDAIMIGMGLYCSYVGCFWFATRMNDEDQVEFQKFIAYVGATIGGIGGGFLWTSQGAYFSKAAEDHANQLRQSLSISTSSFAGIFAFLYLSEELVLRLLSTILVGHFPWEFIFGFYTFVAITATVAMPLVARYPTDDDDHGNSDNPSRSTIFYKVTAAGQLLWRDPKMKYMIGLNSVFGFTSAFSNSYVNGEVVPVALHDPNSKFVGILSAWASATAAIMSIVFGRMESSSWGCGRGTILILGVVSFVGAVLPFLIEPVASHYGWTVLIIVYTCHGLGRATFESTLKATFADYFPYEKEGAFANIILHYGLASAIGYVCT